MAYGDRKSVSYRGGGGGSYAATYDDEGRGASKSYWEAFQRSFERSGYSVNWLLGKGDNILSDSTLYSYATNMTYRYSLHDWAWRRYEDPEGNDGRVRRLVVDKCGVVVWQQFQERAEQVHDKIEAERELRYRQAQEEWDAQSRAALEAREIRRGEEYFEVMKHVDLIAGGMQSQFMEAFESVDIYGRREGDWIDDVVGISTSGYGFGEETQRAKGLKIQVTVSLDLSNSMTYNRLAEPAVAAFRNIYLALEKIKEEHPTDMFVAAFEFSDDGWAEGINTPNKEYRAGRVARRLQGTGRDDAHSLGAVELYRPGQHHCFNGEDTWFYPLFTEIEKWEKEHSDPGAVKIDLILTDAVLEHQSDIRLCDEIQERRDGVLHTVLMNFLPMSRWAKNDLPARCVQYAADRDNMIVALRNILLEYVGVYV